MIVTPRLQLIELGAPELELLARHLYDHPIGSGLTLTREFGESLGDEFLEIQIGLLRDHPDRAGWCVRALVRIEDGALVGHAGFHGPPAVIGRAEIGYHVFAEYRGRGYAVEAARGLVAWARGQGISTILASASADNLPSLAVLRRIGFVPRRERVAASDGELHFELDEPRPEGPAGPGLGTPPREAGAGGRYDV